MPTGAHTLMVKSYPILQNQHGLCYCLTDSMPLLSMMQVVGVLITVSCTILLKIYKTILTCMLLPGLLTLDLLFINLTIILKLTLTQVSDMVFFKMNHFTKSGVPICIAIGITDYLLLNSGYSKLYNYKRCFVNKIKII